MMTCATRPGEPPLAWLLALVLAAGCDRPASPPAERAPARDAGRHDAPRTAPSREAPAAPPEPSPAERGAVAGTPSPVLMPVCFQALPGDRLLPGNEDGTSFDLAFTTAGVAGLAPVEVAVRQRASDFGDADIFIPAAPGATKLLLRRPARVWVEGPVEQRCEPARLPAAAPVARTSRARAPLTETRAWARAQKVRAAPRHGRDVPRAVAAELAPLLDGLRPGSTLRWVRVLAAPPAPPAGPTFLVAAQFDRQRLDAGPDAGPEPVTSLGLLVALAVDDGRSYAVVDFVESRMRSDAAWTFGPSLPLDDDAEADTILLAPSLERTQLRDGLLVALTSWKTVSWVALPTAEPTTWREQVCLGRVDGRPALLVTEAPRQEDIEGAVRASVADSTGRFVPLPSVFAQLLAWTSEPGAFTPPHTNAGDAEPREGPLQVDELRACPLDGDGIDLQVGIESMWTRYWRLSATRAGVARTSGVVDLSQPTPRRRH